MPDFDWNDIRFFLAVVRAGTLTLAARRLRTDHTTVGRRLTVLENALQTRLIDRRPNGCTLTAQGERFLTTAEAMESVAIAARETVAGSDVTLSGTVRIGAPDGFGSFFLAPRIKAFCEQHPELEVQIVAMPRIFNLSKREADLAIGLSRPAEGRLVSRKLSDYHLGLYASRDYLDNAPPIRARRDLAAHSFISYIDDLIFAPELDYMPQVSREIYARLKSSNLIAQMNATTAGAGICVLPRFMAITEPRLVPVLEGTVLLKRSFWLIIHADQQHLARIRSVTAHIVGAAQADRSVLLDPVHD